MEDVGGIAFYANGTRALVADEGNALILDLTTVPAGVVAVPLGNQAHAVAVNAAGTRAAVTIDSGGLQVIDLTTTPPSLVGGLLGPNSADTLGGGISPDGTRAVYVDRTGPASVKRREEIVGSPSF